MKPRILALLPRCWLPSLAVIALSASLWAQAQPGTPQKGFEGTDPNQDVRVPLAMAEGSTVVSVYVHVVNPLGDPTRDQKTVDEIGRAFAVKPGDTFNQLVADQAVRALQRLDFVSEAEYRPYMSESFGSVILAVLVRLRPPAEPGRGEPGGAPAKPTPGRFPVLYQNERSQLKFLLNPSVGVYADHNPWFGNPTAFNPRYDVPSTLAWPEFGTEVGLGGITRVGSSPVYLYGTASYVVSGSLAKDVYSNEQTRVHGETEKLYGGVLVAQKGKPVAFDLSVGRQQFNLNRNLIFGFVLGSVNGGDRGASYLGERTAQDLVVNARLRVGKLTVQGFLADPNELPTNDSRSRFVGVNFKFNDNRRIDASMTVAGAVESSTSYPLPDGSAFSRNGLRVVNPRVRWLSAFGVKGLWLEGEMGHEWNANFKMSANAAGGWVGYRADNARWKPGGLYRYSYFSGDNPATGTYERFDPLLGGVQREWLQGVIMVKTMNNANVLTHRVEVSVKPKPGLELILDFYKMRAQYANNLGAFGRPIQTLKDPDLGYELTPTLQWSVVKNIFLQAVVSTKVPGKGFQMALPAPVRTWTTFQLSVYTGFY